MHHRIEKAYEPDDLGDEPQKGREQGAGGSGQWAGNISRGN